MMMTGPTQSVLSRRTESGCLVARASRDGDSDVDHDFQLAKGEPIQLAASASSVAKPGQSTQPSPSIRLRNARPPPSLLFMMTPLVRLAPLVLLASLTASCGTAAPITPPSRTDLAYYSKYATSASDPIGGLATLYSVDWTGRPHTTIRLQQPAGVGPKYGPAPRMIRSVSPDGSRLLISDGDVLDQDGHTVGHIDPTLGFDPRWAQDDAHLCELTVPGYRSFKGGTLEGPVSLQWVGLDSKLRTVALVGSAGAQDRVEIAACNGETDLAVVIQLTIVAVPNTNTMSAISAAKELMVVQLSTGSFLYRHTYTVGGQPPSGTEVTVSGDGSRVAESLHYAPLALRLARDPASATTIRELPSGRELGTVDTGSVAAFSGSGSLVLTTTRLSGNNYQSQLVDWKSGHIAWERSGAFQFLIAHPGNRTFIVVQNETLWLARDDGSWEQIATGVDELWSIIGG